MKQLSYSPRQIDDNRIPLKFSNLWEETGKQSQGWGDFKLTVYQTSLQGHNWTVIDMDIIFLHSVNCVFLDCQHSWKSKPISCLELIGPWDILMKSEIWNFQTDFNNCWLRNLLWNCPSMNVTGLNWCSVNIGSGNGLVPSGNKPLPEPMLTQTYAAIWRH